MRGVSVIICCYDSSERLPKTLEYLAKQQVPKSINWEIILVNNASKDNTVEVARLEWNKYEVNINLNIVDQPLSGLSNARQKGIEVSIYNTLVFCDDDNWLFPDYVKRSFELSQHDKFGAIGGQGIAVSNVELPSWFESYKKYYACYPQAQTSGELDEEASFLYGAGLIIKKENLQKLMAKGFQFLISDRIGNSLISGGDNELCYALRLAGYKLYYSEDLKFYHFIPESRLTKEYLCKLIKAISYSNMKLVLYRYALGNKNVNQFSWLKDFLYRLYEVLVTLVKSIGVGDPYSKTISRYSSCHAFIAIIHLYGNYKKYFRQLMALKQ